MEERERGGRKEGRDKVKESEEERYGERETGGGMTNTTMRKAEAGSWSARTVLLSSSCALWNPNND